MAVDALTDAEYWGRYWQERLTELPVEMSRDGAGLQMARILDVFDRFLPPGSGGDILEIGGSPGGYLAYVHRRTGCSCSILDFSPLGCQLARENFDRLAIPVAVHEHDLFDPALAIGQFDVAYSLGFCEHFSDLTASVRAHLALVRPGGMLIVGIPNFHGINGWIAERLGPRRLATHDLGTMRLEAWDRFERELALERLFRGHVGGLEPWMFAYWEEDRPRRHLPLTLMTKTLARTLATHGAVLRRFNHPLVSGYLMGVWHVPA